MGNGATKLTLCFSSHTKRRHCRRRQDIAVTISEPLPESLGHSFCYIRPDPARLSTSKVHSSSEDDGIQTTTFYSISGASISANTSTASSTSLTADTSSSSCPYSSVFESSDSFASIPLQAAPRGSVCSSGPMERGFLSGPVDPRSLYSGPIDKVGDNSKLQRSSSFNDYGDNNGAKSNKKGLVKKVKRVISSKLSFAQKSIANSADLDRVYGSSINNNKSVTARNSSPKLSGNVSLSYDDVDNDNEDNDDGDYGDGDGENDDDQHHHGNGDDDDNLFSTKSLNLEWAQGKAGEDRVHIMISEKTGWVFVGIYDGFNGPDAPDFLLDHLYTAVCKELKGLLWNDKLESMAEEAHTYLMNSDRKTENSNPDSKNKRKYHKDERPQLDSKLKQETMSNFVDHNDVLGALAEALKKTEEAYLEAADRMVMETPELAMMGSCVLVMLMKGDDVYLMNVGDSRAVLARKIESEHLEPSTKSRQELERSVESFYADEIEVFPCLTSLQLTMDHSTNVEEEVERIKEEHPDDGKAITKDRVKGSVKVTRAFGAGFLKQPKWNDAVLEAFRIEYIGTSPYLTCSPALCHHKLSPVDRFLILSSDGLYEYFTNEEAIAEVQSFIAAYPTEDPAQHLIEEVLLRAAKRAGMDFYELLDIPQGERRRYHDDVTVIIVSLEGRIWRSSVYRDDTNQ